MAEFDYLQQILGTSNKNRIFSVHQHSVTSDLHVYYGLELFEVVPNDKEDTRFKIMVAHLYNAGASGAQLQRAVGVDPRVSKKWGDALKSGNAEKLTRALAGRQGGRKLTLPIEAYIRARFPSLYADNKFNYSITLLKEIEAAFGETLSAETIRPLLGELKAAEPKPQTDRDDDSGTSDPGSGDLGAEGAETSSPASPGLDTKDENPSSSTLPPEAENAPTEGQSEGVDQCDFFGSSPPNQYADFSTPRWCPHIGLLVFTRELLSMQAAMAEKAAIAISIWASHILMGAQNVEQTKLHSRTSLTEMWGAGSFGSSLSAQRELLGELSSDPGVATALLEQNFHTLGGAQQHDLYFDPHTKQYTGHQNVLKGWCSKLRWADKILNGDYVHTTTGAPIYFENTDSYDDIRERFRGLQQRYRDTFSLAESHLLTWIIDRGIYSSELFAWVAEKPNTHIITWEKGYQRGSGWADGVEADGSFTMQRARNSSGDLKTYEYEWHEHTWEKCEGMRRIIVRATNPNGRTVEVSIITDDLQRDSKEIIWLMFDRWVQENDFKYLDSHFGINEITSYQSQTYAEISSEITDRMMKNAAYTALETARQTTKTKVGKLLYQNREARAKDVKRTQKITELKQVEERSTEQKKKLGSLRGATKSAQRHIELREKKIAALDEQLAELDQQLDTEQKEVSRLDTLIARSAVRLRGERKYLMDVIKITARNIFYRALAPFKEAYDNYRDDHVWFRHMTHSPGVIEQLPSGVLRCHLLSPADYPQALRHHLEKVIDELNDQKNTSLDGSGREIQLVLADRSTFNLAIHSTH